MRETNLISFYVVGDNNAEELEKCFNCLIKQTNRNYEIIFRDNDSKDESYELAVKYSGLFKDKGIFMSVTRNKDVLDYNSTIRLMNGEVEGNIMVYYQVGDIVETDYVQTIFDGLSDSLYGAVVLDEEFGMDLNSYIISRRPSSTKIAYLRAYNNCYRVHYETMGVMNYLYQLFLFGMVCNVNMKKYKGVTVTTNLHITNSERNMLDIIEFYRLIVIMEKKALVFNKQAELPEYHWRIEQLISYAEELQNKLVKNGMKNEAARCKYLIEAFMLF